jgi:hypothetical protein
MISSEVSAVEPGPAQDVLRTFQELARTVGASGALPAKDGCVLFAFERAGRRWRVFWSSVVRPGGIRIIGLPGCLIVQGQATSADVGSLGRRLARIVEESVHLQFDPLSIPPRPTGPLPLSPAIFDSQLARLLRPRVTHWGRFAFEAVREGPDWLDLRFASPEHEVVIEFRPRPALASSDPAGCPFLLRTTFDTRPPANTRTLQGALENYVWYAFRRAFPPGQLFETRRPDGTYAVQDFFDETPTDSFFLGAEHRRVSCQHTLSTVLEADRGVAFVLHATSECTGHYSWINSSSPYGHLHTRPAIIPMAFPAKPTQFVEVDEMGAVMGSEVELRTRLQAAIHDPATRIVVTAATCISHTLNVPVESILQEEIGASGVAASFLELIVNDTARPSQIWADLLKLAAQDVTPEPGFVNLVGYAAVDSDFAREATALLGDCGVQVLNWLVPSFRTEAASRFRRASVTCVSTAEIVRAEFEEARRELPDVRFVDIEPPWGLAASLRFYRSVLELAGASSSAAIGEHHEALIAEWEAWRARASRHTLGIYVRPDELPCLRQAARLHGLDLVRVLCEMGFHVDLLCGAGKESADAERSCATLRSHFADLLASGVPLRIVPAATPGIEAFAGTSPSLLFSEYPSDHRILAAGHLSFGTSDFLPGFSGALRTIVRLVRLAEGRFYRTLAPQCPPP